MKKKLFIAVFAVALFASIFALDKKSVDNLWERVYS